MATSKQNVAIRVPSDLLAQLDDLAKAVHRSRAWLGEDAIRQYVRLQRWQLAEIEAGLKDADAGRVVPHAKVQKWLSDWGNKRKKQAPPA